VPPNFRKFGMTYVYKVKERGRRMECAFLGTSQEEGDEPRERKKKNIKQKGIRTKANQMQIDKTKGVDMHECNMMR
jgi:hypothetical protein